MKCLDLFSGIGGFSLGFQNSGIETVSFCEIDEHCHKVLNKNFPGIPIFKDVTKLTGETVDQFFGNIDIICGGFPCQDISVAGNKKGINNETRSGLWFQYKRLIEEIKPRYVIIENVRNLLSNGLGTVLKDLGEIGYDAEWEIISARDVGACHLRERIWIVAYPNRCNIRKQSVRKRGCKSKAISSNDGKNGKPSDSDYFRFWPTFTTEEEKQQWWAKATSQFCAGWETESAVCGVDDELSKGLDKNRAQRIKQLGNSIVPTIAEIIGKRIMELEK